MVFLIARVLRVLIWKKDGHFGYHVVLTGAPWNLNVKEWVVTSRSSGDQMMNPNFILLLSAAPMICNGMKMLHSLTITNGILCLLMQSTIQMVYSNAAA